MLAKRGLAMPDGGYPIRNRKDLRNAIQAYGRGNSKDDVKRWIKKRAKELEAEDMLPENWRTSMNHSMVNSIAQKASNTINRARNVARGAQFLRKMGL